MLLKEQIRSIVKNQLALDLGCEASLLDIHENTVLKWRNLPGRRRHSEDAPFLELAVWNGVLKAACAAPLLPWAREFLTPRQAEWLFKFNSLKKLDAALAPFGYELGEAVRYFLPALPAAPAAPLLPVRWYEGAELEQFRGDRRWDGPLAFNPLFPDMLAVAALDGTGAPCAMAGVSRDGARLWQIGVTVLPPYRGRGLAANLTALIRDELLSRDIVPFYGTAESHIISQNVAISAGFRPAFGYLYAQKIPPQLNQA